MIIFLYIYIYIKHDQSSHFIISHGTTNFVLIYSRDVFICTFQTLLFELIVRKKITIIIIELKDSENVLRIFQLIGLV